MKSISYVYLAYLIVILVCELSFFYFLFGYLKSQKIYEAQQELLSQKITTKKQV